MCIKFKNSYAFDNNFQLEGKKHGVGIKKLNIF